MVFLYVIKSKERKFRYIGITNNVERRLQEHNSSKNKSTSPYRPFQLVITEEFNDYKEARIREKFLKSEQGRKFLDSR